MTLFTQTLDNWWYDPDDVYAALYANLDNSFYFDRSHGVKKYSVIGSGQQFSYSSFWDLKSRIKPSDQEADLPFSYRPGVTTILNYQTGASELGIGEPATSLAIANDRAIIFGHTERKTWFIADLPTQLEFNDWLHSLFLRLSLIGSDKHKLESEMSSNLSAAEHRESYLTKIHACREAIERGDSYQLCLTTSLRGKFAGDPLNLFFKLKAQNPAPYTAYIKTSELTLVSVSPELFCEIDSRRVSSSPIKGTRPRLIDETADKLAALELQSNEKERAENLMIVDLVRNDLTRVCEVDSVFTEKLFEIQSHPTVHQLVSSVSGILKKGMNSVDAIASLFPAGSMTGAPKISAMTILQDLESSPRGFYAGAFGWISNNGDAELAMTIRSALITKSSIQLGVGGGITWGSDAELEYQEMQLKAKAVIAALGAQVSW